MRYWRHSAALWTAPGVLLLTCLHVGSDAISGDLDGYWETGSLRAVSAILILAPAGAACAAWESGRLRQGGVFAFPVVRSPARAVGAALAPVLLVGVVGLALALCVVAVRLHASVGHPDPRILAMGIVVIAGHIALGATAGRFLSRVVATPLIMLASYLWLVMPAAMLPFSIRHLTGLDTSCCFSDGTVATWGVLGPTMVAAGVIAGSVAVLSARPAAFGFALVITASSIVIAERGVAHFGADPVVPRTLRELVCAGQEPVVCVWPEHRAALPELVRAAESLRRRLGPFPIDVPLRASEARNDRTRWIFGIRTSAPPGVSAASLTIGLAPSDLPVCERPHSWPGGWAVPLLQAWLLAQSGVPDSELEASQGAQVMDVLRAVRAKSAGVQAAWFRANYAAATQCDVPPTMNP